MDTLSKRKRSWVMHLVRSKSTGPEVMTRRIVSNLGYRYKLHQKNLPGSPDLVFPRLKKVIFVNGCFWHRHSCSNGIRFPKSRVQFWKSKLAKNKKRDLRDQKHLNRIGWRYVVVWECKLKNIEMVSKKINVFLRAI